MPTLDKPMLTEFFKKLNPAYIHFATPLIGYEECCNIELNDVSHALLTLHLYSKKKTD